LKAGLAKGVPMFDLKTKILVVDDMMTMRKIEIKILKEIGFTDISEASNGIEAWEKISKADVPFGLVISDWNMPQCSGLDLLKRVRSDQKVKKTPFVMVTAEAEQHQVMEAVKAGVDQYVVKPFNKESLMMKLEMVHKKFAA
jgi:two-component system, chemotaxis family, chemotaxis protein CheY